MKKKIISILLTFVLVVTAVFSDVKAADQTITFNIRDLSKSTRTQSSIPNTLFKTVNTTSGTLPAYCLNAGKKAPSNGVPLTHTGELTSGPLVYILEHGYKADGSYDKTIMGELDADTAYYATSLAVWLYQGGITVGQLDQSIPGCKAAVALYNNAQGKTTIDLGHIYLQLAATTYEMSLTPDGKYYTSAELWAVGQTGTFPNVQVVIESNSTDYRLVKAADRSEFTSPATLGMGEKWQLVIPADKVTSNMSFKVKFSASGVAPRIHRYASSEANKQEIGILIYEPYSRSEEITLTLKPVKKPTCDEELSALLSKTSTSQRTKSNTAYYNELVRLKSVYATFDMEDIDSPSCTPKNRTCESELAKLLSSTAKDKRTKNNSTYVATLNELKKKYSSLDMRDLDDPSCTPKTCPSELATLLSKTAKDKRNSSNKEYMNELNRLKSKYAEFDMEDIDDPSCTPKNRTCESELSKLLSKYSKDKRKTSEYKNELNNLKKKYNEMDIEDLENPSCTPVNRSCEEELKILLSKVSKENRNTDASYIESLNKLKSKYNEMDIVDPTNPSCTPRVYSKKLVVRKIDATTNADIAGATLAIKNEYGEVIEQWISDGNPKVFTNIKPGKYTLVELSAPEGYQLGDDVIPFELIGEEYDGLVEMKNSKIPNTADINFTVMIASFILFLGFGIFGLVKAGRREDV